MDAERSNSSESTAIIGAGPAGLTAAYLLAKAGRPVTVLEADPMNVGGISRTVRYKGYHFDIGGHRFFSKSKEVEDLWTELLPDDMLERPRSSRILYGGKLYSYPLKAAEALGNLGLVESTLCVLSYFRARVAPVRPAVSFEDWVSNQFGRRLFNIFFKTYTEKVWGMSCREISADWAAQRIKGLSLGKAILNALVPQKRSTDRSQTVKTLIDHFRYPRRGPGMMWEACARRIGELGGTVRMGAKVEGARWNANAHQWEVRYVDNRGDHATLRAEHLISSAAIRDLVPALRPEVSPEALHAAQSLRYRDFLTVALIVRGDDVFSDNWIYIHDPQVRVGRIQNFKSWSPEMVPDPKCSCLGLEYFCFAGDELWSRPDAELIELAKRELHTLGLVAPETVTDGCVVRQPKAYPVYDDDYASHVAVIRAELEARFPTFHMVGRNGMHMYNNQDHAMMTAMLTAENIIARRRVYDVWNVNSDAEYHESGAAGSQSGSALRMVPRSVPPHERRAA
ncbi:MAG TPA: NAD(P)/FAD-dependent oxidoreductase [Pirellulales bacterium]|jgi:protoporphyrinogen oxidase|nr:NAD(P)/FAD-dependent oxidoreductase [Pirellulales bacterium]